MDLRNKTTSEFRTVFGSPLGVPKFPVPLYKDPNADDTAQRLQKHTVKIPYWKELDADGHMLPLKIIFEWTATGTKNGTSKLPALGPCKDIPRAARGSNS